MQAAHQVVCFVVKCAKLVSWRLLIWCCMFMSIFCALKADGMHLTLLRRPTQHTRKRRSLTPNTFQARIVLLPPLQSSNALSVFRLHLLKPNNIRL
jgi:hypothetical protein